MPLHWIASYRWWWFKNQREQNERKWLLGSLHEERLRRDSSEQLSIKKMTRQVHLSLCYICRKRRTGLRAVILILRWVSKGKNNLTLATTVEKLTIRKMSRNHGRNSKMKKITTPSIRACILYLGCTSFSTIKLILRGIMTHFHFLTIPRLILEFPIRTYEPFVLGFKKPDFASLSHNFYGVAKFENKLVMCS